MLELKNLCKTYKTGGKNKFAALTGVSISFFDAEFCMVLGPSGCGKSTMLNLIGGLDKPTSGEISLDGKPFSEFSAGDYNAYRSNSVGFIFQNYHLIPHLSVLGNVEIAPEIAGKGRRERREMAKAALEKVGLFHKLRQRPGRLSGGEMQRVAIARALVNNPEIILADEPTGALDSATGAKIADLLKEIAKDRLVIMVTHNPELAEQHATRVLKMLDGRIVEDTAAGKEPKPPEPQYGLLKKPRAKMGFFTSLFLSLRNLFNKAVRTSLTSAAVAFGIAGVMMVIALNNGMTTYVKQTEINMAVKAAINIGQYYTYRESNQSEFEYPQENIIIPYDPWQDPQLLHTNNFSDEFEAYIKQINPEWLSRSISFGRSSTNVRLMIKTWDGKYSYRTQSSFGWGDLGSFEDSTFNLNYYEILEGYYPEKMTDVVLVIDKYNRINVQTLEMLGINFTYGENLKFSDLLGAQIALVPNNAYYSQKSDGEKIYFAAEKDKVSTFKPRDSQDGIRDISRQQFESNLALFYVTSMGIVPQMRAMEADFGIIPFPKADETQDRYLTRTGSAGWLKIPPTHALDPVRTSIIMEALAAESRNTTVPAFKETSLRTKFARDDESAEMINLIYDNIVLDLGDLLFFDIRDAFMAEIRGKGNFVSLAEKRTVNWQKLLNAYNNAAASLD